MTTLAVLTASAGGWVALGLGLSPILFVLAWEAWERSSARRRVSEAGAADVRREPPARAPERELAELARLIESGDPRDLRRIAKLLGQGAPDAERP